MTGLPAAEYTGYALGRLADAYAAIDRHTTSAYTGICPSCGRPGPCPELTAAYDLVSRYAPAPAAPPDPTATALATTAGTLGELGTVCGTIAVAVHQANPRRYAASPTDERIALFHRALADAWAALGAVHAALHEARQLSTAPAADGGHPLTGLRTARDDARRAATLAATVRRQLTVAADQLARTRTPAGLVAARRVTTAITRLDLVAARLAIGALSLERHAAGPTEPSVAARPGSPDVPAVVPAAEGAAECAEGAIGAAEGTAGAVAEIAAGAQRACQLIRAAHRRHRPGFWTRVRHQLCLEGAHP